MNSKLTEKRLAEILARAEVCDDSVLTDYADIAAAMRELQERRKADREPEAWTDKQELRDVDRGGRGYLFTVNPGTPYADERRIILLYRHAQPAPVVPDEKPMPNPLSMYVVDAVDAIAEVKGWNACRAAMLQAGNSSVIPGGGVRDGADKANR